MFKHLELYFLEIMKGKPKGPLSTLLRAILCLLSWPYRAVVFCRNWAFDRGLLRTYYPPVPVVVSIGNIVVGGTGKTPVTLMLAKEFYDDYTIAILSRGYRSQVEKRQIPVLLSNGTGPLFSADYCGDEPYLISKNLPKALVLVGKDRHKASDMAARAGAHLILLDDGMQHRRLARDFEIVVMDACDPFGQGHFLPHGFLRESVQSLARADLIIANHIKNHEHFEELAVKIKQYSAAPLIGTQIDVLKVIDLNGNNAYEIKGKRVGIFCGIAQPHHFQQTIESLGAEIVAHYFVADHVPFDQNALKEFGKQCQEQGAVCLICTEKDRVKLADHCDTVLPVYWLQMGLKIVEGEAQWKSFIEKTKKDLIRRM